MRVLFALLIVHFSSVFLCAFAIDLGQDLQAVNRAYGAPRSRAVKGEMETWYYKEGSVVFVDGKVREIQFYGSEPRLIGPAGGTSRPVTTVRPPTTIVPLPSQSVDPVSRAAFDRSMALLTPEGHEKMVADIKWRIWGMIAIVGSFGLIACALGWMFWMRVTPSIHAKLMQSQNRNLADPVSVVSGRPAEMVSVSRLTLETLQKLEWRRVEELSELYFNRLGWQARRSAVGADGGVDVLLSKDGQSKPSACVQCKQRSNELIGVKFLREFYGVMVADGFTEGFYVTTSRFSSDAVEFAKGKSITLIDAEDLVRRVSALPDDQQAEIVRRVFRDDYMTPTCPSCDVKLIVRGTDHPFWGCRNYPRCRTKIQMSRVAMAQNRN